MRDHPLSLLHPSLGLAFTENFEVTSQSYASAPALFYPNRGTIIVGNKASDALPAGCDGCRENLAGDPICCLGVDAE